jgi:hypothetical protein
MEPSIRRPARCATSEVSFFSSQKEEARASALSVDIHFFTEPQEYELYDLQADPEENDNLYGKPGYEALTAQLAARLETLRRETGDNYVYHPSRTPHLKMIMGPPEEGRPHHRPTARVNSVTILRSPSK